MEGQACRGGELSKHHHTEEVKRAPAALTRRDCDVGGAKVRGPSSTVIGISTNITRRRSNEYRAVKMDRSSCACRTVRVTQRVRAGWMARVDLASPLTGPHGGSLDAGDVLFHCGRR